MKYCVLTLGLSDPLFSSFKSRFGAREIGMDMALDIRDAIRLFTAKTYHMVLADLGYLKNTRREELLAGLRRASYVPIVVLTDHFTEAEVRRLTGLGVDLVMSSGDPWDTLYSLAAAQLRRYTDYNHYDEPEGAETASFQVGDFYIDPPRCRTEVRGRAVELRRREFNLLLYLMRNPGVVLTTEQICEHAWGLEYPQSVGQSVYDLRQKIEPDPNHPIYIETVYRIGYRFTAYSRETCG